MKARVWGVAAVLAGVAGFGGYLGVSALNKPPVSPTGMAPAPLPTDSKPASPTAAVRTDAPDTPTPTSAQQSAPAPEPAAGQTVAMTANEQTPPAAAQTVARAIAPSFDIMRIEPSGDAVLAGKSGPGATVEVLRDGVAVGRTVADAGGQWAFTPPALAKGDGELSLRATDPDGRATSSEQVATIRIPEKPGEEVIVALTSPDAPTKVLSETGPKATPAPTQTATSPAPRRNVAFSTVEADERGRLFVTGTAQPGAVVRIYLNDAPVALVTAADDGRFSLTVEKGLTAGQYRVRIDDIDQTSGSVLTRAEAPFAIDDSKHPTITAAAKQPTSRDIGAPPAAAAPPTDPVQAPASAATGAKVAAAQPAMTRAPGAVSAADAIAAAATPAAPTAGANSATGPAAAKTLPGEAGVVTPQDGKSARTSSADAVVPELKTVQIVRGDNLWRLSRKLYGRGIRYTWIYDANTDQIRNPNLIYPDQILVAPPPRPL